jgi:hypothetical protein
MSDARAPGATPTTGAPAGVRRIWLVLGALAIVLVTVALGVTALGRSGTGGPHKIYAYTVPPGTVAGIERGEKIYIFPARLDVRVGDQLVIHNNDTRPVEVGPYTVDRNAVLTQTFIRPGTIIGICTIHPSGQVTINVRA